MDGPTMAKRKGISASLRWQVFARDNFTCRYCGARAGQEGVELAADHLISVVDGGDNSFQNLITACKNCNGGKGAKSLAAVPDAAGIAERMAERAESIRKQAEAMALALEMEGVLKQAAVNLKCQALNVESVRMDRSEITLINNLCREFGAETVLHWYRIAADKTTENHITKYVCGIARNVREANRAK